MHYNGNYDKRELGVTKQKDAAEIRRKIKSVAGKNGWGIAVAGALGVIYGLWQMDIFGMLVGSGVVLTGWNEAHARTLLKSDIGTARTALRLSQIALFLIITISALLGIHGLENLDTQQYLSGEMKNFILGAPNVDMDALQELLRRGLLYTYLGAIALSLFYQGGLFLYYTRKTSHLIKLSKSGQSEEVINRENLE